jgi:hypothetical protein
VAFALLSLAAESNLAGCSVFEPRGPSAVAQGKYYASGNAQYDQFFISLFDLQVALADAPGVPETERAELAQAVGLSPQSPSNAIAEHLREEAQKLSRVGVRLRIEESPAPDDPKQSAVSLHTTSPAQGASRELLNKVESSAANLLRVVTQMNKDHDTLRKLEADAISLDAAVDATFATQGVFKKDEVRKNLADAQRLITLMKDRSEDVRNEGAHLLAMVEQAITTDDSAAHLPPPPPEETGEIKGKEPARHAGAARPRATSTPSPAPKNEGANPAPSPAPAPKAAPAPKDFEP